MPCASHIQTTRTADRCEDGECGPAPGVLFDASFDVRFIGPRSATARTCRSLRALVAFLSLRWRKGSLRSSEPLDDGATFVKDDRMRKSGPRTLLASHGRQLTVTPVFDTYWRFAAARQRLFDNRTIGAMPPWTADPIIAGHRFTNVYRASDRVSQYLIRNVIYDGRWSDEDTFFRILLFKIFNRIDTWELLRKHVGEPSWSTFDPETCGALLDRAMEQNQRLYSAAYIMPSPAFGSPRKHRNHFALLEKMMRERLPARISSAQSLREVYELLLDQPSLGAFLAFQFAIDLNYSDLINFSEMNFVVAGPGARDGISKCFADNGGLSDSEIIEFMAENADAEFERLGLEFRKLGGKRPLQLIDCQNVFCEVSKYARVAHPECVGEAGRTRIKQRFTPNPAPLPQKYPPKWNISITPGLPLDVTSPRQQVLGFAAPHRA